MTKTWHDLKTIHDFIECCEEDIHKYNPDLGKEKKENLAAGILSLTFTDHFKEWAEQYPDLYEIEMLASDLEWSNSSDIDEDWEKLRNLIAQLEREVSSR